MSSPSKPRFLSRSRAYTGFLSDHVYVDGTCPYCRKKMEIHESEMTSGFDNCPKLDFLCQAA